MLRAQIARRLLGWIGSAFVLTVLVGIRANVGVAAGEDAGASIGMPAQESLARARKGELAPPDLDDIEHMCALLTSCDKLPIPPSLVPQDFASCVRKLSEDLTTPSGIVFSLTLRECGLAANSCASLQNCALRGASINTCKGRGKGAIVGYCDVDGRAISCWHDQVLAVRDCPRGGEQCVVSNGLAECALGPCPDDMKTLPEGKAICSPSGTRILRCNKGKLVSLDCAAFGLKCSSTPDGSGCATSGPPCGGSGKRCDGNIAVGCYNGHEVRVDCSAAGLVCQADSASPVGACAAPVTSADAGVGRCDPGAPSKCDGANIQYCFAGEKRSFFCKPLGFNRCESGPRGARCSL